MSAVTTSTAVRLLAHVRDARRGRGSRAPALAAAALCLLAAGWALCPDELGAEAQGAVTHWGGWPLERAFSIALLVGAWLSFRVVEVAFRTEDAHALELLPVPGIACALDRLALLVREAMAGALLGGAFLAPALARPGGAPLFVAALGFLTLTGLMSVAISFGAIAWAGGASTARGALAASLDGRGERAGALYHSVPGAAFGVAAFSALFAKLGVEEPLRVLTQTGDIGWTNAASVALGVPLGVAALLLLAGLRAWRDHFHDVVARFREAEGVMIGGYGAREDKLSLKAEPDTDAMADVIAMQLRRRHPLTVPGAWIFGAIGLMVAWSARGTVGPLLLSALAVGWLLIGANPARRVRSLASLSSAGTARWLIDDLSLEAATRRAVRDALPPLLAPLALPALALGVHGAVAYASVVLSGALGYALIHGRTGSATAALAGGFGALALSSVLAWSLFLSSLAPAS